MEYKLIRSARKTIGITIYFNNEVVIRCPKTTHEKDIEKFLEAKKAWIDKCMLDNEVRFRINKGIFEYKEVFLQGKKLPLTIGVRSNISESGVCVKSLKRLKPLYVSYFENAFEDFVADLAHQMRVKYKSVEFKSFRSKWGCCDFEGNLTFNYRIFMLPNYIMRYIVLHELCHITYFDHSKKFWGRVERFEPDFKNIKNDLKNYDFLMGLY